MVQVHVIILGIAQFMAQQAGQGGWSVNVSTDWAFLNSADRLAIPWLSVLWKGQTEETFPCTRLVKSLQNVI